MIKGLQRTIRMYQARGFQVTDVFADNEFECIDNGFLPYDLNTEARYEHVPEFEQSIRTVKEYV